VLSCALLALAGVCVARMLIGGLSEDASQRATLLELRGLRVASGLIVGAALAAAGVLLQSLMRNALASPDLLGLSSGSALGVMGAVYATFLAGGGLADPGGISATGAAIGGACLALALVYVVSQRGWCVEPTTLVLVGVMVGIVCAALVGLVQQLLPDQGFLARRLLVGALRDDVRASHLWTTGALTLVCVATAVTLAPSMDVAAVSDDEARSMGVSLARLRTVQFLAAGVLTACAVVLAGPIGFVGLVCPHAARMLCGPRHMWLVLVGGVFGAAMLVGADALVALIREVHPGLGRLPVGVLTALIGGPVFLWMLRAGRGGGSV
jgi:iron complex transport system permease protein